MIQTSFSRVAIVNRGESAMRLVHAVRELNAQYGRGLTTIALFTEGERSAMFAREADEAYCIGPASARPYLDHAVLARALRATRADAAWVGWGFVAEDPAFADLCADLGVTFIGPSSNAMRMLGDKIGAKLLAEKAEVPVSAWSGGPLDDVEQAVHHAEAIGYPLMLKAAAGGGGRGIRVIRAAADLHEVFDRTREEAQRAFGSGVVFLERMVTGARHVEVQIIADSHGTAWALGVRDCSVQRRNQKVIEESASPLLTAAEVAQVKHASERLALAVGYCGAGTVEFLFHPGDRTFAFLEVNTRLQVEHPVTELTTDVDLVRLQLHVASSGALADLTEDGAVPLEQGHAVEARLNAEDPDRDFAPAPGRIDLLRLPTGPGVRVDTGVGEGDVIPADFDSMIAKIIAHGPTRDVALGRLRRALHDTTVVIRGGTTNKSFILDLLDQPEVIGDADPLTGTTTWADTGWIDRVRAEGRLVEHRGAAVALLAAAIEAYDAEEELERTQFLVTAHGGRPQARHEVWRSFDLRLRGSAHKVGIAQIGPRRYRVQLDASAESAAPTCADVTLQRLDAFTGRLTIAGSTYRVVTASSGPDVVVEVGGIVHRVTRDEAGVLRAHAPALVVAVPVALGDEVQAGQPLAVLESMKMETVLVAPFAGRVKEILTGANDQVEAGAPLLRLEQTAEQDGEPEAAVTAALDLPWLRGGAEDDEAAGTVRRAERALADLRALILGYDLTPDDGRRAVQDYLDARNDLAATDEGTGAENIHNGALADAELSALRAFADLCELARNRPVAEESLDARVHSPREYLHAYLHSLDVEREHLPEAFRERLARALAHYGVHDLQRGPALEEAVFRVFLAQQRTTALVGVVSALLERWLTIGGPIGESTDRVRDVLDRLVRATQLRYPVIGDLARSARFRWFEEPIAAAARFQADQSARAHLAYLRANPGAPDYAERIDILAGNPEPMLGFLAEHARVSIETHEPLLEILARRHYRGYTLDQLSIFDRSGHPFVTADYALDDRPSHLVSTVLRIEDLTPGSAPIADLEAVLRQAPAGRQNVVDLYLVWPDAPDDVDVTAADLLQRFGALDFSYHVRRAAVAVIRSGVTQQFTLRPHTSAGDLDDVENSARTTDTMELGVVPSGDVKPGLFEDLLVRGLHPMVGRRLDLWRLRDFHITRLPAPEGVWLYKAVAPNNPSDQRLVALTQARELTVVRDAQGRVTSLPQAERAVARCMDGLRRARAAAAAADPSARLDMNHVWLHIWPAIDAPVEELTALQATVSPLTAGAGVEEVVAQGRVAAPGGRSMQVAARFTYRPGAGVVTNVTGPPTERLAPLDDYAQKVLRSRRRNTIYPYELVPLLTGPRGSWVEYDLEDGEAPASGARRLVPVQREPGRNRAGIVAGIATTPSKRYPDGVRRVVLMGDPTKQLGAVAGPECERICAALDLAESLGLPVEWFTLSSGARISMDSGTENMDWVARALRRIIEFTQGQGEINVVVAGINVGAQPYWNAEATMLMHTKGVLIMTPESAMVLTGKTSLDYSGGVSAEDNFGIGGYDRVMGPNGQAQYWAPDLTAACSILSAHYDHAYLERGEEFPRPAITTDPAERDVRSFPHRAPDSEFTTIGDVFSAQTNPERKKPFDIRSLLKAVSDADHPTLERWAGMADAETSVVLDAHLGGHPVCLIGIESRPIQRRGFPPSDGPDSWSAGTLFPRSSKKTARAINAASGVRPLVVLANLSGFDGSPESMRTLQLEYGAEIGRAVVNFDGPIVFCVVSRYHGGAFVVFSKTLHDNMQVLAVEGAYASVIGGAPAAGVVFTAEVDRRTSADARVRDLESLLASSAPIDRVKVRAELTELRTKVRSEKLSEVADEFDAIHSMERAVRVGSVDKIIPADRLRPELIAAIESGMTRHTQG